MSTHSYSAGWYGLMTEKKQQNTCDTQTLAPLGRKKEKKRKKCDIRAPCLLPEIWHYLPHDVEERLGAEGRLAPLPEGAESLPELLHQGAVWGNRGALSGGRHSGQLARRRVPFIRPPGTCAGSPGTPAPECPLTPNPQPAAPRTPAPGPVSH